MYFLYDRGMASASNCYHSFLYLSKYQKHSKTQLQKEIIWPAFTNCALFLWSVIDSISTKKSHNEPN